MRRSTGCDVELVQAGHGTVVLKLNLELHLGASYGLVAYGAGSPNARAAPGAVRSPGRELPVTDSVSGFLAEDQFVGHLTPGNSGEGALATARGGPWATIVTALTLRVASDRVD